MKIKNLSREGLDFVVDGKPNKDNVPPTEHIAPGETKDIDVLDTEGGKAQVAARVAAGLIEVSGAGAKALEASAPAGTAPGGKVR